jgi:alkylation response protein AidB-like acyl-CoA dehydrogenase
VISAVRPGSAELAALLAEIGAGAAERERAVRPPHDAIDLVRRARLGAIRVPVERGGGGATVRELFETLIALAAADSNVAHILRTHFQFVEERIVAVGDDRWMGDVLDGAIFGNATTELGTEDVGGRTFATTLDGLVLTGTKYPCTAASTRISCPSSPPPPRGSS